MVRTKASRGFGEMMVVMAWLEEVEGGLAMVIVGGGAMTHGDGELEAAVLSLELRDRFVVVRGC